MKRLLPRVILGGLVLVGLPALVAVVWWVHGPWTDPDTPPAPHVVIHPPKGPAAPAEAEAFFEAKIRPVLETKCLRCHGGEKVRGGLRLDSRAALLQGGEHGPAVVPGDAAHSLLIQALRYTHDEVKMPPGAPLPAAVVDDFATWVNQGAAWITRPVAVVQHGDGRHWAFEPVRKAEPPADPSGWSVNPIDRFVRAKLWDHGLEPAGPADRRALIRRVTFDL